MMHKIAALVFLLGTSLTTLAQNEPTKKVSRRPDIPGAFVLEFGFNQDLSAPDQFALGFWGSRTANIYYQYEFRILKSSFSFVPGIGLSLERFKFNNDNILDYDTMGINGIIMVPPNKAGYPNIRKSHLITNYIEIPLEIRYNTNPDDPARSFKVSVGGRIGYMYDAFTKVKWEEYGDVKKTKNKEDFNLNKLRYGLTARLGIGNFSIFGYYNLTPLFKEGKGLSDAVKDSPTSPTTYVKNDFSTITIGISLASF